MRKLNTFNKIFILFWIAMIIFIILKVPHERNSNEKDRTDQFDKEK